MKNIILKYFLLFVVHKSCASAALLVIFRTNHYSTTERNRITTNPISTSKYTEPVLTDFWSAALKSFNDNAITYVLIFGICVTSLVCYKYKKSIIVWLYAHRLCLPCIPSRHYDSAKEFDAFVQYSPKEPSLIWEYAREFEYGKRKFKFCYWQPENDQEATMNSMIASKEILILMTKSYLESEICRINFYMALKATSMDRFKQMIVIIYPDVEDIEQYGKEMKKFLELCTCLERDDSRFFNKLLFTLPHQTKHDDNMLSNIPANVEIV